MRNLLYLLLLCVLASCKTPEARRPVSQNSGSYIDASIARNKKLNKAEESAILKEIKNNPEQEYIASADGFWYTYDTKEKDSIDKSFPQVGDVVTFTYDIQSIAGEEIVSKKELGTQTYQIDQSNQELMPGLRAGIKLMREGETVTFLFPSHKAFGYYGYENKIGMNRPIKSTVTLQSITLKTEQE
ncbi:gliding motility-associated peptidyl-prolyl isomerase GldI [Flavimarina sp. Hel_I_48]|uniref:gliding motility-associated peptidyl-prolyl isomerase GldI n=1 Tax=Flavimarina sp. Hel_I_48 TaxID=1392488 RepID=UPI0004DEF89F|nr:gliding motility-associated peptidyl-prolyl isomerase GldI [Flavimarina sp. Hel_I_48]